MLYLIDANVIITAKDYYYEVDRVPEFWEWLVHHGEAGNIKIPIENWEEVSEGPDKDHPFYKWRKDKASKDALVIDEDVDAGLMQRIMDEGYGENLTDDELATIAKDPFLVAYSLNGEERCVVTTEVSAPSKQRQNRKLPDVCRTFGVTPYNTFDLVRLLNFSTSWKED